MSLMNLLKSSFSSNNSSYKLTKKSTNVTINKSKFGHSRGKLGPTLTPYHIVVQTDSQSVSSDSYSSGLSENRVFETCTADFINDDFDKSVFDEHD